MAIKIKNSTIVDDNRNIASANTVTGVRFVSTATSGAPLTVSSSTVVTNLNADQLDGLNSTDFVRSNANDTITGNITFTSDVSGNTFSTVSGTSDQPAYGFTNDTGNGMYLFGPNTLGFSTIGKPAMAISSTGNLRLFNAAGDRYTVIATEPSANVTVNIPFNEATSSFVLSKGNLDIDGLKTFSDLNLSGPLTHNSTSSRDKIRLLNSSVASLGVLSTTTYGGLSSFTMTAQMMDSIGQGFWWGHMDHTTSQGAMALTTDGKLTVADSIRVGYGQSDTTDPGTAAPLEVNGLVRASSFASANGSNSAPAYDFLADPDTGMFLLGSNLLGFATGGSTAAAFTSTGNLRLYNTAGDRYITLANQPTANVTITIPVNPTGSTILLSEGDLTVNGAKTFSDLRLSGPLTNTTTNDRDKIRVWNTSTFGIGMTTPISYGALSTYAMTFQMNDVASQGFWWGDVGHANNQGAMALTTDGKLTVADSIRVGYGQSDTTSPGIDAPLEVNGNILGARLRLTASGAAGLTSDTHGLQVGSNTSINMIFDANDIQARNNSAAAALNIQNFGGDLNLGNTGSTITINSSTTVFPKIASPAPSITFTGDTNTGIGSFDADTMFFVTAGNQVANFGSGGNFNSNYAITAKNSSSISNDIVAGGSLTWSVTGTMPSGSRVARLGVWGQADTEEGAGYIQLAQLDNGQSYIWADNSSVLRVAVGSAGIGLANTGTIIGTQTSDERLKDINETFDYGISEVRELKPIKFSFKQDGVLRLGFGAQTTRNIIPETVYDTHECIDGYTSIFEENGDEIQVANSENTKLAMDYSQLIPVLTKAIQQLDETVQNLSERLAILESLNNNGT